MGLALQGISKNERYTKICEGIWKKIHAVGKHEMCDSL